MGERQRNMYLLCFDLIAIDTTACTRTAAVRRLPSDFDFGALVYVCTMYAHTSW